jgi:GH25 family lysozyme M1 (1,4-beta-N-acetylmuramidase)
MTMADARGIDAYEGNGEIDFALYPGIDFAFFKATETTAAGTHYDSQFARSMVASAEHYGKGFIRHAYAFVHPAEAVQPQVSALVSVAKDAGLEPGDHYMMDLEVTDGLGRAEVSAFGVAFCHQLNKAAPGHRCIVYTFLAFAEEGNCAGQWPWRLFIADWDVEAPSVPQPWAGEGKAWSYWQFAAGTGSAHSGVLASRGMPAATDGGTLDQDEFNGGRSALWDFCRLPADRR